MSIIKPTQGLGRRAKRITKPLVAMKISNYCVFHWSSQIIKF